jgi:hypothetical protein
MTSRAYATTLFSARPPARQLAQNPVQIHVVRPVLAENEQLAFPHAVTGSANDASRSAWTTAPGNVNRC